MVAMTSAKVDKIPEESVTVKNKQNFLGITYNVKRFTGNLKRKLIKKWLLFLSPYKISLFNDISFFKEELELFYTKKNVFSHPEDSSNNLIKGFFGKSKILTKFLYNQIQVLFLNLKVFEPHNTFIVYWNILLLAFMSVNIYYNLLEVAFAYDQLQPDSHYSTIFNHIPSILLILNVFIYLNTAYYSKGDYIKDRKLIAKRYFKSLIFIDFFTIVPYFVLMIEKSNLIRLFLLLRFLKFKTLLNFMETHLNLRGNSEGIFQLTRLFLTVLYSAHLMACFWIYAGLYQELVMHTNSWISENTINVNDYFKIYITAFYFSTVTMITVGYGDIHPYNTLEKILGIIAIFLSCGVFAYSINSIGNIIEKMSREEKEFKAKLADIDYLMSQRNINRQLQIKIKGYLEYMHEEKKRNLDDVNDLVQNILSDSLREEYNINIYGRLLIKNQLYRNFSKEFLNRLCQLFKEVSFAPNEEIFKQEEIADKNIYFVMKGEIELFHDFRKAFTSNQRRSVSNRILYEGQSFGNTVLMDNSQRHLSAKSIGVSRIAYFGLAEFLSELQNFEDDKVN